MTLFGEMRRDCKRRMLAGLLMCSLLCTFAVLAKTSMYSHHPRQVHSLTATKVWQKKAVDASQHLPTSLVPAVIVLLSFAVALEAGATVAPLERPCAFLRGCCSPLLFVRPPPIA